VKKNLQINLFNSIFAMQKVPQMASAPRGVKRKFGENPKQYLLL
jgi:hypothetical protein